MLPRLAPAALCLALCACSDSSGPGESGPYRRFLVLGGSMAAGVETNGLTAASQANAWPALLAQELGTTFRFAAVADPGCPPPYMGFGAGFTCAGLAPDAERRLERLASFAVPGARLGDALAYEGTPVAAMNELLLGPYTQKNAMAIRNPTFLAIQLGDEDVQRALTTGDASAMTGLTVFTGQLDQLMAAADELAALEGGVIVGVIDPTRILPALQPGAYFYLARDPVAGTYFQTPVNNNCSPVNALGQPNALSANLVSHFARAVGLVQINCDPAAAGVLTPQELATVQARVADMNAALAARASARGWAFVDPNTIFLPLVNQRDADNRYQQARLCQDLPAAHTAAQFQAAVLNSCPVTGQTAAPNFFGALFSWDGRMLSADGQSVLAHAVAAAVRAAP